jgi:GTPase SAR1 family protein
MNRRIHKKFSAVTPVGKMGCSASKPVEPQANLPAAPPQAYTDRDKPTPISTPTPTVSSPPPKPQTQPQPQPQPRAEPQVAPPPAAPTAVAVRESSDEAFGLLLCGSGESGKTTYTRQLKLRFHGKLDSGDREAYVPTIRGNLVETMQTLLRWAEGQGEDLPDDVIDAATSISSLNAFNCDYNQEVADALESLWATPAVQTAFRHKDETVIPDHMDYFFDQVQAIMAEGYSPTDDDILRARIRSIGIDSVGFEIEGAQICIFDVGGQQCERGKWEEVMERVSGVIFCVSFADFDKPMFELLPRIEPRITDSIDIFDKLTHRSKFEEAPFFLICNKFDAFKKKIQETDCFLRAFPEYEGDAHDPDACATYLTQKFLDVAAPLSDTRPIVVYRQDALDGENVVNNTNEICRFIRQHYFEDVE